MTSKESALLQLNKQLEIAQEALNRCQKMEQERVSEYLDRLDELTTSVETVQIQIAALEAYDKP